MMAWYRRHGLAVSLAAVVVNAIMLAITVYLTFYAAPVIVDGHRLDNCTMTQEPDRQVWTCHP